MTTKGTASNVGKGEQVSRLRVEERGTEEKEARR